MGDGPKGFDRLRPVGHRSENRYDWRRLIWPAESLQVSRRVFLKSPAMAALSLTAVRAAAETLNTSERLIITREFRDGPIRVQLESIPINTLSAEGERDVGSANSQQSSLLLSADTLSQAWFLDPAAFGPDAKLDFRMSGSGGSAEIYVSGIRYGALSGKQLNFEFRRVRDQDDLDLWYISLKTSIWDGTWLGTSQVSGQVRLLSFMQGDPNARLIHKASLTELSASLPSCFNGLLNFPSNNFNRSDQIPISYDRDGIWRLESLPPRLLEGAVPGVFATGLSMCMTEEQSDLGPRLIFQGCLNFGAAHADDCCDAQVAANGTGQPSSVGWQVTIRNQQARAVDFVPNSITLRCRWETKVLCPASCA